MNTTVKLGVIIKKKKKKEIIRNINIIQTIFFYISEFYLEC